MAARFKGEYMVVQVRKGIIYRCYCADSLSATSIYRCMHNAHRYSFPETYLYEWHGNDYELLDHIVAA